MNKKYTSPNFDFFNGISFLTGLRPDSIKVFILKYRLDPERIWDDLVFEKLNQQDFVTAVAGTLNNKYFWQIIKRYGNIHLNEINESIDDLPDEILITVSKKAIQRAIKDDSDAIDGNVVLRSFPFTYQNQKIYQLTEDQFEKLINSLTSHKRIKHRK